MTQTQQLKIEIDTVYTNGWGKTRLVAGLAKTAPINGERVFYTMDGDWYTESGRAVSYSQTEGHVLRSPNGTTNYDLGVTQ